MHPRRFFVLVGFVMLTALGVAATPPATLRLRAITPAGPVEEVAVRDGQLVGLKDGAAQPLPRRLEWKIEGDLAANAALIHLSPQMTLSREQRVPKRTGDRELRYEAAITLTYAPGADRPAWDARAVGDGVVVFGWVVDGACVQALAVAAPDHVQDERRIARAQFVLPAAQARGFPIVMLWKGGRFVAPRPWFTDAKLSRALAAMHFESPAAAAEALSGLDPKAYGVRGTTLLHIAAESGIDHGVQALIKAGASLNAINHSDNTALSWAARNGRAGAVELLLAGGAKPEGSTSEPAPLAVALSGRHDAAAAALVRGGASFKRNEHGEVLAWVALDSGMVATSREIAAKGGYKGRRSELDSRLAAAVRAGASDVAELLIECGANPRQQIEGRTLLSVAAENRAVSLVNALVRAGVEAKSTDKDGTPALLVAVRTGSVPTVEALLAGGADPNAVDRTGVPVLFAALELGDAPVATTLLARGARATAKDREGRTALEVAGTAQSGALLRAILAGGGRPDLQSKRLGEVLAGAIIADVPDVLAAAAEQGWDARTGLAADITALDLARFLRAADCTAWLEKRLEGAAPKENALLLAVETAPKMAAGAPPADVRAEDRSYAAEQVVVSGVVSADGRMQFPRVQTMEPALRRAALEAVRAWKFSPGQRGGKAVPVAVSFPINFPALDRRIYELNQVEVRPKMLREGSVMEAVREYLERNSGFYMGATRLTFVVEKDGTVKNVFIPADAESAVGTTLRRALADYRFAPGERGGHPVRVWIDTTLGLNVEIGKAMFEPIVTGGGRAGIEF